jgi:hypothetical protein
MHVDVRHVLPTVRVPTLVVHREGEVWTRAVHGRYLADHITGAQYVEVPGDDHFPWSGNQDAILDEIEEFVTGARPVHEPDRVLATVLFTDIVSSTERASRQETDGGSRRSNGTTRLFAVSSTAAAVGKCSRPATVSLRRSTVRQGPFVARARSRPK